MPSGPSDHLANERTFLAWVRTSISVIVFGFVVARFGITLRELLRLQDKGIQQSGMSLAIGMAFMFFGVFIAVASLMRYHKTRRRLEEGNFEPADGIITILGTVTAFFGSILIAYVLYASHTL
jgi:putative membrane protein